MKDRLEFCRANIKRQIFICGTDEYLRYLEYEAAKVDAEFESIPWGHCQSYKIAYPNVSLKIQKREKLIISQNWKKSEFRKFLFFVENLKKLPQEILF